MIQWKSKWLSGAGLLSLSLAFVVSCSESLPPYRGLDDLGSDGDQDPKPEAPAICEPELAESGLCMHGSVVTAGHYSTMTSSTLIPKVRDFMDKKTALPFVDSEKPYVVEQINMGPFHAVSGYPIAPSKFLKKPSGAPLNEFFLLKFRSVFQLPRTLFEGSYEFAVVSDDGIRVNLATESTTITMDSTEVPNPVPGYFGYHRVRLSCGDKPVALTHEDTMNVEIQHANGNAAAALIFLMRPTRPGDSLCGEDVMTQFKASYNETAQRWSFNPMEGLLALSQSDNWFVVPASALYITIDMAKESLSDGFL